MWVRTRRLAPGEDYLDYDAKRVPGPWHTEHQGGQTWCGKRPGRLVSSEHRTEEPPADERRCEVCERAKREGRARARR